MTSRAPRWRVVVAAGMLGAALLVAACDGASDDGSTADPGGRPAPESTPAATDPLTDVSCDSGDFQVGEWSVPRTGDPATVAGLTAAGGDDCVALRIRFTGTAPGVEVTRLPLVNETYLRFTGGGEVAAVPFGPVDDDLLRPGYALLDSALIGYDEAGLHVHVGHGLHADVSARVVLGEQHVDVYFRLARAVDAGMDRDWSGDANPVMLTGQPDQGLAVLLAYIGDFDTGGEIHWPGPATVVGYAKAPESSLVVRLFGDDSLVCERPVQAAGPPYLFSRFGYRDEGCLVDERHRRWEVEVGWPDPADGPGLWQRYSFAWPSDF